MPDEATIAAFRDQLRKSEVVNGLSANPKLSSDALHLADLCEASERKTAILRPSKYWLLSVFN